MTQTKKKRYRKKRKIDRGKDRHTYTDRQTDKRESERVCISGKFFIAIQ